jgi:hypothetical protein
MKITCDLQLTLMASSLYRLLGAQVGRGYEEASNSRRPVKASIHQAFPLVFS